MPGPGMRTSAVNFAALKCVLHLGLKEANSQNGGSPLSNSSSLKGQITSSNTFSVQVNNGKEGVWRGLGETAAKSLQSCPTLCNPIDGSPPGSPHPWDSPGKNTGVGCHFLLQCMKVKSESEVAQSCPTLRDPMDCSPPGYSIHGIFQARVLE